MKKNIKLAEYAGFCYGVKRAVENTKKIKYENPNKKVWVLGELIHNSNVVNELENIGVHTVNSLNGCENGFCIIRSHGMPLDKIEEIKNNGFDVVDLTCPDVKKVQEKAVQLAKDGFLVLIIGKEDHPEVVAIKANVLKYTDKVFVVSDVKELNNISTLIKQEKKTGVVVQTTQKAELLQEIISKLVLLTTELKVYNTICKSTELRQKEAVELAKTSDIMIVVGGKNSANTTHLAEITSKITNTIHIETADDIDLNNILIKNAKNIGITAGASTPKNIINDVINKLKKGQ